MAAEWQVLSLVIHFDKALKEKHIWRPGATKDPCDAFSDTCRWSKTSCMDMVGWLKLWSGHHWCLSNCGCILKRGSPGGGLGVPVQWIQLTDSRTSILQDLEKLNLRQQSGRSLTRLLNWHQFHWCDLLLWLLFSSCRKCTRVTGRSRGRRASSCVWTPSPYSPLKPRETSPATWAPRCFFYRLLTNDVRPITI